VVVLLPSSPLLYYGQEEDAAVAVSFVAASEHERERERERESLETFKSANSGAFC
jgi:hypothetical protein